MNPSSGEKFAVNIEPLETSFTLDYTILEIRENLDSEYDFIHLEIREPLSEEAAFLISYPRGGPAVVSSCLLSAKTADEQILHRCKVDRGSAGSLLISEQDGSVLGLHFAGSVDESFQERGFAHSMAKIAQESELLCELANSHDSRKVPDSEGKGESINEGVIDNSKSLAGNDSDNL